MYRKRDRSQEQSRFFIFVREGMQSAGFVDGVWYGSGAVPMPAVVAALVCGGGRGMQWLLPLRCRRWIKRKGPHRCDADPFLIFHVCASYASWIASLGQTSAQVPQLKHFSGSIL